MTSDTKLTTYDVRVQLPSGARVTVRVRTLGTRGARQQALARHPDGAVVSVRRSQYAR